MIFDLMMATMRLSIPLLFAAYGGLLSERSGIANIALESYLLVSAFAAAAVTALTGQLWLGVIAGLSASALTGFCFAGVCIWGRGDQIVIGTAFNLLAVGLIPTVTKALFNATGSTPALSQELTFHTPWVFFLIALFVLAAYEFLFRFTRHGLRIWAAGENPDALLTQGVNYKAVRLRAVVEGSMVAGIGGIYLSLCQGSGYIREMAAGRGFIALAALIFGAWRPVPTFLACLFFAFTDAVQMLLQGQKVAGHVIPNQFIQILPYLATLFVLIFYARRISAPKAINTGI
jgi:ABC-type uncharacterized transport system permease subunit